MTEKASTDSICACNGQHEKCQLLMKAENAIREHEMREDLLRRENARLRKVADAAKSFAAQGYMARGTAFDSPHGAKLRDELEALEK